MSNFTLELLYGKHPIRRTNPKVGETLWYYLDPRGTNNIMEMKKIDVMDENSPNPFANEIKNYLYNNNSYVYNNLYGNPLLSLISDTQKTVNSYLDNNNFNSQLTDNIKNDALNFYDNITKLYNTYKEKGLFNTAQEYAEPSVKNALSEATRLTPIPISDTNKHQYVSCMGSTGGILATTETLLGGIKKEFDDYAKKSKNQVLLNQYGGKTGILKDNLKDLYNDFIGSWDGFISGNPEECNKLLPAEYRK